MSSQQSEEVLFLLKELSMLKTLDTEYERGCKSDEEEEAHRLRQQRHEERRFPDGKKFLVETPISGEKASRTVSKYAILRIWII